MSVLHHIVRRTLRVPTPDGPSGDGAAAVRQFDAVLMSAGFKLSDELFGELSLFSQATVLDTAVAVLAAVRNMVGDHVEHNSYFRDFPRNVPDTVEFWSECLLHALADPDTAELIEGEAVVLGTLNLLSLPKYGRYQHSYAEMLAAQPEFIEAASDRITVLRAGVTLREEAHQLYLAMASVSAPGSAEDREVLAALSRACVNEPIQPHRIPVRENRALINEVRIMAGADPLIDTVTDVLRLSCALSGGDVTLTEVTVFGSFPRTIRRALMSALDHVVSGNKAALADVGQYKERWKRLGERLHPHEYTQYPGAAAVFAVARGELQAPSLAAEVEALAGRGAVVAAATLLHKAAPGQLFRAADRLLRISDSEQTQSAVASIIADSADQVSGRLLLSLREHLANRPHRRQRVFVNRKARGRVIDDTRAALSGDIVDRLSAVLDAEISGRLSHTPRWVVDPQMRDVALPISGKTTAGGFGTLPRGSSMAVKGDLLRFFVYWRQHESRTDFDLSALMLSREFDGEASTLSYASLHTMGGVHSGDITDAPDGATEFIDIDLSRSSSDVVIPQVNIYSGESFDEVAESFFGYMLRGREQDGRPFEPRTVRMKSELRGGGRVALPMVFVRDRGMWRAVWLHLHLAGHALFNRVETNRVSTRDLVKAAVEREYLTVGYLADLMGADTELPSEEPVTYIGWSDPGDLPPGSTVITPANLVALIPD